MASAQESTDLPSSQAMEGQRMPLSCLTTESTSTPALSASEIKRQVASSWADGAAAGFAQM